MSQSNSNNDPEQENHRKPNFILPLVNSIMRQGGKKQPEEPAEKVVGEANIAKPTPKRKVLKQKRKPRKRRQNTSSNSDSEEIERTRRRKARSGQKRKRKSPSS